MQLTELFESAENPSAPITWKMPRNNGNRYQRFGEWLQQGLPVEMPEVSFNEWHKCISFGNGRHRFSWFRDHGTTHLPVCVPEEQAAFIKKNFG